MPSHQGSESAQGDGLSHTRDTHPLTHVTHTRVTHTRVTHTRPQKDAHKHTSYPLASKHSLALTHLIRTQQVANNSSLGFQGISYVERVNCLAFHDCS